MLLRTLFAVTSVLIYVDTLATVQTKATALEISKLSKRVFEWQIMILSAQYIVFLQLT